MEKQKYISYSQIDQDLEILKLKKEISYQKVVKSIEYTKENLKPKNLLGAFPKIALDLLGGYSNPIKNIILSFIIKKILK